MGQAQYRPWCRACVAAMKPDVQHSGHGMRQRSLIPEVHADFCFFRDAPGAGCVPCVVLKDRDSLAISAHILSSKGTGDEWVIRQIGRDLQKWGIRADATFHVDQEDAIIALFNEVIKQLNSIDWLEQTISLLQCLLHHLLP